MSDERSKVISEYFAGLGRKGGKSTSDKKREAVRKTLDAVRARRWPKAEGSIQPPFAACGEPDANA